MSDAFNPEQTPPGTPAPQATSPAQGAPPASPAGPPAGPAAPAPVDPTSMEAFDQEMGSTLGQAADATRATRRGDQMVNDAAESAAMGAFKGIFETKDFFLGEPDQKDKTRFRRWVEGEAQDLERQSPVNGVARSIAQFGVGFVGLGKVKYVAKGLEMASAAGKGVRAAAEIGKGAAVGAVVFDPHDQRLSNLVEAYPTLSNPITQYLAASPKDSAAEGRMKNALEGIVLDVGILAGLTAATKAIKLGRAGDRAGANAASEEASRQFALAEKRGENTITPEGPTPADLRTQNTLTPDQQALEQTRGLKAPPMETGGPVMSAEKGETSPVLGLGKPDEQFQPTGPVMQIERGPTSDIPKVGQRVDLPSIGDAGGEVPPRVAGAEVPGGAADNAAPGGAAPAGGIPAQAAPGGRVTGAGPGITPEGVQNSLRRVRQDAKALDEHGSYDAAVDAGYRFKPDDGELIPWQKLNTSDELKAYAGQITDPAFMAKMKGGRGGVMSDAAVDAMVRQRARVFNEDPEALLGQLKASGAQAKQMVVQMETSYLVTNRMFRDAYELAQRIGVDNFTGFTGREAAMEGLRQRMAVAVEMMGISKQMSSSMGRGLRRMRSDFQISEAQLGNIRTMEPSELANLLRNTGGDPAAIAKAGRLSLLNRIGDAVTSVYAANLLWGWGTHAVNFGTSAAMMVWRPAEKYLGAEAIRAYGSLTGNSSLVQNAISQKIMARREAFYIGSTVADGWNAAKEAFLRGESVIIPQAHEASVLNQRGVGAGDLRQLPFREINGLEDVVYNGLMAAPSMLTGSLRAMGAADEMIKTMRYRSIIMARASHEADGLGLKMGSPEYQKYIKETVEASFDDAGRGIDSAAVQESRASTFQNELVKGDDVWMGTQSLGKAWQAGTEAFTPAKLVTPFVRTPVNLFRYGWKMTPGLNLLQKEYVTALLGQKGIEAQAQATGQMMLGTLLTSSAALMWGEGKLVGSGPVDPKQNKQWRAQGNLAWSIKYQDEQGKDQFFQLNRFDPIAMPFLMVADALTIYHSGYVREEEKHGVIGSVLLAVGHSLRDKTYLKNVGDFITTIQDDRRMGDWAKRWAPGLMPFSSLMSNANSDPYAHEVRAWQDGFLARIPGMSKDLPAQRDAFGDPILIPGKFMSEKRNPGPLDKELDNVNAVTGRFVIPANPVLDHIDLRDFTLTEGPAKGRTAYDRLQELAGHPAGMPPMRQALEKLVQTKEYQALPHGAVDEKGTRSWAMGGVMQKYREAGTKALKAENADLRTKLGERQQDIFKALARPRQSTSTAAGASATAGINRLLTSYGLGAGPAR